MNDLIRPSLYKAFHQIVKVNVDDVTNDASIVDVQDDGNDGDVIAGRWDIVGPICETGDFLGKSFFAGIFLTKIKRLLTGCHGRAPSPLDRPGL